jgi:hypothetical protein
LTARVVVVTVSTLIALAAPSAWLAGVPGLLGVVTGGGLALTNFWWLRERAAAACARGGTRSAPWMAASGLRLGLVGGTCATLLATGSAHPIALVAGLTVFPCVLVVLALGVTAEVS